MSGKGTGAPRQKAAATPIRSRGRKTMRPQKTAMLLAQRIVSEITDGGMVAGDPLAPERTMLEQYNVSRGTLRETLRFLEIQGVITIKTGPNGGPIVGTPGSRHLASVIAMRLQLTSTSFRAVLEAREAMEPAMARQAAERIEAGDLDDLRASTERMAEQLDDVDAFLTENETFHALIAKGAGNELFSIFIASLNWICDATPLGVHYPRTSREKVLQDHVELYAAIADRDAARAGAAMTRHIGDFAAYLEHQYPAVVDAALRWDQVDP